MTAEQYGPVSILAIWELRYKAPLFLVTNLADLDEAVQLYKKRPPGPYPNSCSSPISRIFPNTHIRRLHT
jgi:hypothetical protein